jgi:hypothetical protein
MLNQFASHPAGALALLAVAAFLESFGDSLFQTGLHRSTGTVRFLSLVLGSAALAFYGATVNAPRWNFGSLIGVYVVFFFLVAQILAKVRFNEAPTAGVYAGGSLIVAGGLVIAFWRS